jgi:predicted porin
MQKKIIALAVAGLVSGAAFAQSNVTVYGKADVGYVYSKSDFRKYQGIDSGIGEGAGLGGGSRLGFKGEEGLGNGLKAVFNFEWGTNVDEGSTLAARWSYVGLAGNFGEVRLGRNRTPVDLWKGTVGANGFNTLDTGALLLANFAGSDGDNAILSGKRWNNSIAYTSPNFSGVQFLGIYSFGEKVKTVKTDKTDTSDAGKLGLGVRYDSGALNLFAAYEARADDVKIPGTNAGYGIKGYFVGGAYDFKAVKVFANYARAKANHSGQAPGANDGSDKQTFWSIGAAIPVSTPGTVTLEYGQYKDYLNGIRTRSGFGVGKPLVGDSGHKAKGYTVGYNHNLSRRTAVYAFATFIDNDKGVGAGWTKTGVYGEKQTIFATGVVHNF